MSTKWLDRPVHTRTFEHEGKTYIVRAFTATEDPTLLKIEASVGGRPVPIPGLADGIMPHQPPHEDYQVVLQEVERLLRGQPQGLAF